MNMLSTADSKAFLGSSVGKTYLELRALISAKPGEGISQVSAVHLLVAYSLPHSL